MWRYNEFSTHWLLSDEDDYSDWYDNCKYPDPCNCSECDSIREADELAKERRANRKWICKSCRRKCLTDDIVKREARDTTKQTTVSSGDAEDDHVMNCDAEDDHTMKADRLQRRQRRQNKNFNKHQQRQLHKLDGPEVVSPIWVCYMCKPNESPDS